MTQQAFSQFNKQSQIQKQTAKGALQRKCERCREKEKILQRPAFGPAPDTSPPIVHAVLHLPGQPLDKEAQNFIRPRFSHDFSQIPVHSRSQGRIQAKLAVNAPGDVYEQEADRVADLVMVTPGQAIRSAPPQIQRLAESSGRQMEAPASVDQVLASPGRPLEPALRQDMEQRFGYSFSRVRVHTGTAAEQSARDVNAHAYTVGYDIVFGTGRLVTETHSGRRLLAHELVHVVQQGRSAATGLSEGGAAIVQRQDELTDIAVAMPERPVTPDEMVRLVVDQRHWSAGPATVRGGTGLPAGSLAPGARGTGAGMGYHTYAAIQILDREGSQVAFELSQFRSAGPHAETQAMTRLQPRLAGGYVTGGRMIVAVDQYACPDCIARLRNFAQQNGLACFEVYVPARDEVSPKTAARTAATRPAAMDPAVTTPSYRITARLAQGESFVPYRRSWQTPPIKSVANLRAAVGRAAGPGTTPRRSLVRGALGAAPQVIDWGVQLYNKGFIEFGEFEPTGERLAVSSQGFGTVRSHVESLSTEMRLLVPEEAERVLKDGEYFVNKSGPVTSKLSHMLMDAGYYEWFELWQIQKGRAVNTKCRTDKGSSHHDISKRDWTEADLRQVWNRRAPFRCPSVIKNAEPDVV